MIKLATLEIYFTKIPEAKLLIKSKIIVPSFLAPDADFRIAAILPIAEEKSPNPVPRAAPSHNQ